MFAVCAFFDVEFDYCVSYTLLWTAVGTTD